MLTAELRSLDKPPGVQEAERLGRRAAAANRAGGRSFGPTEMPGRLPAGSLFDRVASIGLTLALAMVLFLAVTALAQARYFNTEYHLAQAESFAGSTVD